MLTFLDSMSDSLVVRQDRLDSNLVVFEIRIADPDENTLEFSRDDTRGIAHELLRLIGDLPPEAPEVFTPATVHGEDPVHAWNLLAAEAASNLDLPIRFRYTKGGNGDPTERRLTDVHLAKTNDDNVLVLGSDPDRADDVRSFRLDWIRDYLVVG